MDLNRVAAAIGVVTVIVIVLTYAAPLRVGSIACGTSIRLAAELATEAPAPQETSDRDRCAAAQRSRRNVAHMVGLAGMSASVLTFLLSGVVEERRRREYQRHPRGEPPHHT